MNIAELIVLVVISQVRPPSPLDRLDPTKLAAEDRPPGSPKELVALLPGHTRAISSLTFSPGGDVLASASWDNTIRLWRFGKETPTAWATLQGSASNLAMAPDGKVLAAGSAGTSVQFWSLAQDPPKVVETLAGHKHRPFSLVFAPSGKMFVSGCNDPVLRLWKLGEGEPEAWGVLANENVPSLGISALSFSKDSKLLAAGGFAGEKTLRLWSVAGNFLEEIELPKTKARLVAFSPTENLLAFAGDEAIQLWDVDKAPPRPVRTFSSQAKKSPVQALAFSRDGRSLLSAGQDKRVVLWDVAGGKRREWQFEDEMRAVAFAPDGRHLALGSADGFVFVLRVGQQP